MTASFTIPVTAEHEYPVIIGRGLLGELPGLCAGAQRVAIIHWLPRYSLTLREILKNVPQEGGAATTARSHDLREASELLAAARRSSKCAPCA